MAEEQTEGRGRLGRQWDAPPGTSVLASLVLRPDVPAHRLPELSLVAGEAVAEAVASVTALDAEVRFPNDVLVHGHKIAGILAEASDGRVVLGIGVNVNQVAEELPAGARTPATSLRLESGARIDRAEVLATILERLERRYDKWLARERAGCKPAAPA
ncbi:MAG: biotin--[acetyl-CoA-carboxylase] ligase [Actinomycetota bacterium]|nr:biotin--[acetyl-CoA-carboxylase] ligase [Actinomycetota bacterium]